MAPYSFTDAYDSRQENLMRQMRREQAMLDDQRRQMERMLQQQMYPMYQMGVDPGYTTSTSTATTNPSGWTMAYKAEFKQKPCQNCGRAVEVGSYCVCQIPMAPPGAVIYTEPKCPSCGERAHRQRILKGQECDRTKGLRVKKQAENFRKLYWHRRMMNPERFEKTT